MELSPQEKYLFKPFVGSSHDWALIQAQTISSHARVLDIGAGSGAIGKTLRERGFTSLDAVEIDPSARVHIAPIYSRVASSLEAFTGERFDLVLLLDVLEHLTEPTRFLEQVTEYMEPGATLLVSVPNVAHWSVRLPLLFGRFNYTNRGILDRTHFQFFTRARFRELIQRPTLTAVTLGASIEPAEFLLPRALWENEMWKKVSQFRKRLAETLPGFFAYQHLARLERIKTK